MTKLFKALIFLLVIASLISLTGEVYFGPWFGCTTLILALIFTATGVQYGWLLSANITYWLGNALWFGSHTPFEKDQHIALLSMSNVTKDSVIALLLFVIFGTLYKNYERILRYAFSAAWLLQFVSLGFPRSWLGLDGFLGSTSIGLCFLATTVWLLPETIAVFIKDDYRHIPTKLIAICALAVILPCFHSATAWLAFGIGLTIIGITTLKDGMIKSLSWGLPGVFVALAPLIKPSVNTDQDRYELWVLMMKDWWQNANHFFGYGHGTYKYLGPQIQFANNFFGINGERQIYLWAHNDWLQLLFEGGFVGLFLVLCLCGFCCFTFYTRQLYNFLASTIVLCFIMLTQYPLELPIFGLFCVFLLMKAYETHAPPLPVFSPKAQGEEKSWI